MKEIIKIKNLDLINKKNKEKILKSVSITVRQHRTLGIVGESGSGKSMLARSIMGIMPDEFYINGEIIFNSKYLLKGDKKNYENVRGNGISIIFQNGYDSFNPIKKIKKQFIETVSNKLRYNNTEIKKIINLALEDVGLTPSDVFLSKYPHELSGGQLQRLMIAIAMIQEPLVVIADEPTTSLDLITQFEIINNLKNFNSKNNCTMIFITHDVALVQNITDDIAVMKDGEVIEYGATDEVLMNPKKEYTKSLIIARNKIKSNFLSLYEK